MVVTAPTFDPTALERTLPELPQRVRTYRPPASEAAAGGRPGDDFNARASWAEVIEPHGWAFVYDRDGEAHWCRPGKRGAVSATTNYKGADVLHVFTSSTVFEKNENYNKFSAFAILNHAGDFSAAAKALAAQGYGAPHRNGQTPAATEADDSFVHTDANELAPVPPFPTDCLPSAVRAYVEEGAAALGCSPDFIALPLLGFAGAVMGKQYAIVLKRDYRQRAGLYLGTVGEPGSVKTPALLLARVPLDGLQAEALNRYKQQLADYEVELANWLAVKKRGSDAGPKPEPPTAEHFFTTDSTMEALAEMLGGSAGVAFCRDELVGWVQSFDAYRNGRGGDRQNWLSLWAGAGLKVDRKSKPSIYVPEPVVSVVGSTQPDCLPLLSDEADRRDGFLERILWGWPDTAPAQWTEEEVSAATREALIKLFRSLRDNTGEIRLSDEARTLWIDWYNAVHEQARAADGLLAGILAKLPNQIARVALILHVLEGPETAAATRLPAETMWAALTVADYFIAHALRVLPHLSRPKREEREPETLEHRVWRHLDAAGDWLSKSGLHKALGGSVAAAVLDAALAALEGLGVAEQRTVATGRHPRTEWRSLESPYE